MDPQPLACLSNPQSAIATPKRRGTGIVIAAFLVFTPGMLYSVTSAPQDPLASRVVLRAVSGEEAESPVAFLIGGWTEEELAALSKARLPTEAMQAVFSVSVRSSDVDAANPPLRGSYQLTRTGVLFSPRFTPMPGVTYELRVLAGRLPEIVRPDDEAEILRTVRIPKVDSASVNVTAIYPSADELPENLLKFYLHFSGPMTVGDSYEHVTLLDVSDQGAPREVELPFLTLEQELWNHNGTRLTLLFDPGRIKRGLKPREEEGPALLEGNTYEFVVRTSWRDANGVALAKVHRKRFRVTAPDDEQPDPDHWEVTVPQAGTRDPLILGFREPLDRAMLMRVIDVRRLGVSDSASSLVRGEISVDAGETGGH